LKKHYQLLEIAWLFLKLGLIGFGGPPANISFMEQETVHKRKWIKQDYFLDILATTNFIHGPNAAEMATHLGCVYAGMPGLFVAGITYIFPSILISLAISIGSLILLIKYNIETIWLVIAGGCIGLIKLFI